MVEVKFLCFDGTRKPDDNSFLGGVRKINGRIKMKWAYGAFALLLMLQASAWMLEKKGIMQITGHNQPLVSLETIKLAVTNPYLIVGLSCAGLGLICWLYLLSQFNLSYIYPLGSLLYIIIAVLSYFLLGEPMPILKLVGIGVIATGCVLINL